MGYQNMQDCHLLFVGVPLIRENLVSGSPENEESLLCERKRKLRRNRDEVPHIFDNLHGFSTVDGFVEINECMSEMIKYVANEPSAGLYYVQQHTQNAVPNVIRLRNNVTNKSRDTTLHTEDLEDSITTVSSMKECGLSIADEMIGDIKKSLALISKKQPKKGLIDNFQLGRTSSWGPTTWGRKSSNLSQLGQQKSAVDLFSNVFKTAKEKASNIKWPQLDEKELMPYVRPPLPARSISSSSSVQDMEAEELPLSSAVSDDPLVENEVPVETRLPDQSILSESKTYEDFKSDREAKLREWLEGGPAHDTSHSKAEV
ncbi:hypothetical protein ACFE04_013994 [Oxalis oulophora]